MKITRRFALLLAVLVSLSDRAAADTFGSGLNTFDIEFVDIGNPGNVADTTGAPGPPHQTGSVPVAYRIGKYEISEQMIDKANVLGLLGITQDTRGPNKPATSVSWFEAAKFINWLNIDANSTPAYKFDGSGNFQLWAPSDPGYNPNNLYRNSQAKYFLPSVDEWYKAAYFDPSGGVYYDYPTGSNAAPTAVASGTAAGTAVYLQSFFATGPADIMLAGGLSPYGTAGQGGNVYEWEETDADLLNDYSSSSARGVRGGNWGSFSSNLRAAFRLNVSPSIEFNLIGFRVASIPEPSTVLLGALAGVGVLQRRRR